MDLLSEKITEKGIPCFSTLKEDAVFRDKCVTMELVWIPKIRNRALHTIINQNNLARMQKNGSYY